jgi:hypothetical protein
VGQINSRLCRQVHGSHAICGEPRASDGGFQGAVDEMKERSIQSTVRYTELAPGRFKHLWR